jgi:hypothetical protein
MPRIGSRTSAYLIVGASAALLVIVVPTAAAITGLTLLALLALGLTAVMAQVVSRAVDGGAGLLAAAVRGSAGLILIPLYNVKMLTWAMLVAGLGLLGRHAAKLAVAEWCLGLAHADYRDADRLAEVLDRRLSALLPDLAASWVVGLATALSTMDRKADALALVEAFAVPPRGVGTGTPLAERLEAVLRRSVIPVLDKLLLTMLCTPLLDLGREDDAIRMLELHIGLEPGDYDRPERVAAVPERWRAPMAPDVSAAAVALLASLLAARGDPGRGVLLLGLETGLDLSEEVDPAARVAALASWKARPNPPVATNVPRALTWVLREAGRSDTAAELQLLDWGIAPDDFEEPARLAGRLAGHLSEVEGGLGAHLVLSLVDILAAAGRMDDASRVLDAYLTRVMPLERTRPEAVVAIAPLYELWLAWLGPARPAEAWEACRRLVAYLRISFEQRGSRLDERRRFAESIAGLRRQIILCGYREGRHFGDGRDRAWIDALLWDAELGQRSLLERIRLRFDEGSPNAGPDERPAQGWALRVGPPHDPARGGGPLSITPASKVHTWTAGPRCCSR